MMKKIMIYKKRLQIRRPIINKVKKFYFNIRDITDQCIIFIDWEMEFRILELV